MGLSFGVEIELLVCPRDMQHVGWDPEVDSVSRRGFDHGLVKKQARNRSALRSAIANALSDKEIPATSEQTADYRCWSIVDEESLDEIPQYCKSPPPDFNDASLKPKVATPRAV